MSGTTPPGSPPPEVPEEFAAAYRAAYEQALAAQTVGAQHRDDSDDGDGAVEDLDEAELPVRRGPIRVGTHRTVEEYDDEAPTWFERVRDSRWFVPLLLALLALLLILGAYAVGRRFAGQVASDESSAGPRISIGEVITLDLGWEVPTGEVGLIPGYSKTDEAAAG